MASRLHAGRAAISARLVSKIDEALSQMSVIKAREATTEYRATGTAAIELAGVIAKHIAGVAYNRHAVTIPTPRFEPTSSGAVDVHWLFGKAELVLAVPNDTSAPLAFFGDTRGGDEIRGTIARGASLEFIASWLAFRN